MPGLFTALLFLAPIGVPLWFVSNFVFVPLFLIAALVYGIGMMFGVELDVFGWISNLMG